MAGSYDGQPNIRRDMNRYREKLTGDLKGLARLGSHPRAIDIANILLQQGRVSELLLRFKLQLAFGYSQDRRHEPIAPQRPGNVPWGPWWKLF